jgi:uncharacterized protein YegJ (DUF2314 family)
VSTVYSATPQLLAEASAGARATFKYFWRELSWERRRIVPTFDLACVKVAFEERGKTEHMWVRDVDFDGEIVTGTLMNEPNELTNVREGDSVRVPLGGRFSDWMLSGRGAVLGAFTVQAIRAAMSEGERRDHDEAWGLPFGDPRQVSVPPSGDDHPIFGPQIAASLEGHFDAHPEDLQRSDDKGYTMLHREALAGNAGIVRILLARGASASARSRSGKTPLALARAAGWPAVEAILAAAGAKE